MSRYVNSFLISFILYASIAGAVLYALQENNYSNKEAMSDKSARICFSVVTPNEPVKKEEPKEKKPVKKVVEKQEKKPVKKVEKKVVEKKFIAKEEPKAKQKKVEEKVEKEEVVKQEETPTQTVASSSTKTSKVMNTSVEKAVDEDQLKAKRNAFIARLVERINANKCYPTAARRRAVEGDVKVEFHILSDGTVKRIKVLSGKDIFKESTLEAISRSFPMPVDKSLFEFPKAFTVTIAYILH